MLVFGNSDPACLIKKKSAHALKYYVSIFMFGKKNITTTTIDSIFSSALKYLKFIALNRQVPWIIQAYFTQDSYKFSSLYHVHITTFIWFSTFLYILFLSPFLSSYMYVFIKCQFLSIIICTIFHLKSNDFASEC